MGIGTTGITPVPWDSHGNGSDSECVMGMGVEIRRGNITVGMGMISYCI